MSHFLRLSVLVALIGVMFAGTGCANKKKASKINALEAQVGVLTDEVSRLDQSIQEIRGGAQAADAPGTAYKASAGEVSGSVYRTPSGFELPSANIQKALKGAGYYQGRVDGKIGTGTKDAVKAFQRDHGLEADGVVGRRTWDKLKVYLEGASAVIK